MTYQEACKILGVSQQSTEDEIKQAYKKQAKKYHPDLYQGDKKIAEEKMKQINEAYALLNKPGTTSSTYSNSDKDFYNEMIRDLDILIRKMKEQDRIRKEREERRQKEMEELNRKIKKIFKPIFILFILLLILSLLTLSKILVTAFISTNFWFGIVLSAIWLIVMIVLGISLIWRFIVLWKEMFN